MRAALRLASCVGLLLMATPSHAAGACEYSGRMYSAGATICECPSFTAENIGATGETGQVTSRRLSCAKEEGWIDTKTFCVSMKGTNLKDDYYKLENKYCPKTNLTVKETETFFAEAASKDQTLAALKGICRRLGSIGDSCRAFVDALK